MKTLSSVLLFVVAVVAMTSGGKVPDFTEDALQALELTDPNEVQKDAKIFNANLTIIFEPTSDKQRDGVKLYPFELVPLEGQETRFCQRYIGIQVAEYYSCDVEYFLLRTKQEK